MFFGSPSILSIAILFCFVACYSSEQLSQELQRHFSQSTCDFTLALVKKLAEDDTKNVLVSPASISMLLSILQQGANNESAQQLEGVLGLNREDSRASYRQIILHLMKEQANTTLEWGNRAYVMPGFSLNPNFKTLIKDNYQAEFQDMDFGSPDAASQINNWVANVTRDHIKDLISPGVLTADTVMVLVNAIFFKGLWTQPFNQKRTRPGPFRGHSKTHISVPFMSQTDDFYGGYNEELGAKWVELTFAGSDDSFSAVFILPTEDHQLNPLLDKLNGTDLMNILDNNKTRRMKLKLPKFKLSEKTSLVETLTKLGLTDIFTSGKADLTGISQVGNLFVSDLIHQANIEVDEEGSTASAATAGVVNVLSINWHNDEIQFYANQPFLLFIVDKTNRIPLFAAKIVNPKE